MASGGTMLKQDVEKYIALHQGLGFKFKQQSYQLRNFADYAVSQGQDMVKVEAALEWAKLAPSALSRSERLRIVRRFAKTMAPENPAYEIPPAIDFGTIRRRTPHIFTSEQILQIISAAWDLNPIGSLRSRTYATLFALLPATGLRISEAIKLRLEDVTEVGLVIRETKFKKSRLVPLHQTVKQALDAYLAIRRKVPCIDGAVFISSQGKKLAYPTVVSTFLVLARKTGVRSEFDQHGPRIHDFRHTFAVRSLEQCPHDHNKIHRHMHALSTYLGHAHIADTYWYLQATPKLLIDIAECTENLILRGSK